MGLIVTTCCYTYYFRNNINLINKSIKLKNFKTYYYPSYIAYDV